MALPRQYDNQACSVARALEIVGERWTLLLVRDAFFGVRRFTDFAAHLDIPRAVLSERLGFLTGNGVLERVPAGGREEYVLTAKGRALWPVVWSLSAWGDDYYAPHGPRRLYRHAACATVLEPSGRCPACGALPPPAEIEVATGPGMDIEGKREDPVTVALRTPHPLLEPLATA